MWSICANILKQGKIAAQGNGHEEYTIPDANHSDSPSSRLESHLEHREREEFGEGTLSDSHHDVFG